MTPHKPNKNHWQLNHDELYDRLAALQNEDIMRRDRPELAISQDQRQSLHRLAGAEELDYIEGLRVIVMFIGLCYLVWQNIIN